MNVLSLHVPWPGAVEPAHRGACSVTRSRRTAREAGAKFETLIAGHLAHALDDDRIERRAKSGAKDRGDIGGVSCYGHRVVIECKNVAKIDLPAWTREAQLEAGNDDALVGLVIHKRHRTQVPGEQWVTCTVDDLVALITGQRVQDPDETRETP